MNELKIPVNEELFLSSWQAESAPHLFALVERNREHLSPWLPWVPSVRTVQDSETFILSAIEEMHKDKGLELGIWYRQQLAGCVGLHELNQQHHKTSIGYWLGAEFQGHGLMTKAVQALVTYCFQVLEFNRVEIRAAVENEKSRAIPTRLGFMPEGTLRQAERVQGRYLDIVVYGMLRQDWQETGN